MERIAPNAASTSSNSTSSELGSANEGSSPLRSAWIRRRAQGPRPSVGGWRILTIAYNLGEASARDWGLYLSEGQVEEEPAICSEPGLFLVRPDTVVEYVAINSSPSGRPDLGEVLEHVDFVLENHQPPRGSYEMVPERDYRPGAMT